MDRIQPGPYLRLRREAAGLSIDDVALLLTERDCFLGLNRAIIASAEAGAHIPTQAWMARLRTAYRFDPHVWRLLGLAEGLAPDVCQSCGCSDLDPCDDEIFGPCAWATSAHDICTSCLRLQAAAPTVAIGR